MTELRRAELGVLGAAESWARAYLKDDQIPPDASADLVAAVLLWLQTKDFGKPKRPSSIRRRITPPPGLTRAELKELDYDEDDIPTAPAIKISFKP